MAKKHKSQTEVIEALRRSGGIISDAAKLLDMTREHLSSRVNKSEILKRTRDEVRESEKDLAEAIIHDALVARDKDIAKWYLSAQARDRGYGNKQEVELKGKIEVDEKPDLSKLSEKELNDLEQILKKTADSSAG